MHPESAELSMNWQLSTVRLPAFSIAEMKSVATLLMKSDSLIKALPQDTYTAPTSGALFLSNFDLIMVALLE